MAVGELAVFFIDAFVGSGSRTAWISDERLRPAGHGANGAASVGKNPSRERAKDGCPQRRPLFRGRHGNSFSQNVGTDL